MNGRTISETEDCETNDLIASACVHVDQIMELLGSYLRGNDDKNAAGDEGEVDEEDDVEEGEVAQRGHVLAVGAHQVGPETGCQQGFPLDMKSHMLSSMKSNMVTLIGKESVGRKKAR